jgi:nucleotide-binding universal stress UspA family protein
MPGGVIAVTSDRKDERQNRCEVDAMKILLAIDDSDCSAGAAKMVGSQFRPDTVEVQVLSVVNWIEKLSVPLAFARGSGPVHDVTAFRDHERTNAEKLVAQTVSELRTAGLHAEGGLLEGDAHDKILEFAKRWQPDLIVMGSHSRRGVNRLVLGSVAETVFKHASCSVEIVRNAAPSVAHDGHAAMATRA